MHSHRYSDIAMVKAPQVTREENSIDYHEDRESPRDQSGRQDFRAQNGGIVPEVEHLKASQLADAFRYPT